MTDGKEQEKQHVRRRPFDRRAAVSGAVQIVFVLIGVALTAAAYIAFNGTVQTVVRDEYNSATKSTVETLSSGLSSLQSSVESASEILSLSGKIDRKILAEKVRKSSSGVERFDQVIWVYEAQPGQWQFTNIYEKKKSGETYKRFSLRVNKDLVSYIINNKLVSFSNTGVYTDLEFISHARDGGSTSDIDAEPFALMRAVNEGDATSGILIGVGTVGSILNETWLRSNDLVSRFTIREPEAAYSIYNLEHGNSNKANYTQVYEFDFADSRWEARIEFMRSVPIEFIEAAPLFIVVFGLMITAFGALYVRSNSAKTIQVSHMYRMLEEKNAELEAEVTKRSLLNEKLERSEQENRSVIDAVSDIIFETDTDGTILFLNGTWRKVTGFDPEQSVGLELFKMLHPQDQEQQIKDFQLMVRGQKQPYRAFTRLRTSDGAFRAVELALSMVRQDGDKNLRIVGTITDVEERRRTERALSEAEKKYRAIVENAAGGIYQLTPEGLYLSANLAMARIIGYDDPDEILKNIKNANEEIYVDMRERQGFLRELEKRGVINNFETQVYKKDGTKIWINENARAVRDDSNNTLYYEGSIEDITRRKDTEIVMKEAKVHSDLANRAKSEFLANMSHELRTPLNAVIGFSEMIKNEVFGPIGQKAYLEYAKDIYESGNSLLNIINEILDISKIEAGDRQLNEAVVDLNKVVDEALAMLSSKVEINKTTIANMLEDVPHIVGEELAIKQILMNLLSNAIKFTPSGGRVTIGAEVDADTQLRLSVTDTGIGLDESEIGKALSPFGQIDNELSRSGSGTGLGLTLVDALIKLHGGELELFSQKGIGTTVTVIFPSDRVTVKKSKEKEPKELLPPIESEDA